MATTKPTKFINAVDINGELYYVSDSYVEDNYLPLTGNQTLTGQKKFTHETNSVELGSTSAGDSPIQINYDNNNYYAITLVNTASNSTYKIDAEDGQAGDYYLTLPSQTGTLALRTDIPTVNNATLTIQKNGTNVATFTANSSSNATANITVPTKVSELTNDSGYLTSHQDISGKVNKTGDSMSGNLNPATNKGASLGTSSLQWNNIYGTSIYENGTALSNKYASKTNLQEAYLTWGGKNFSSSYGPIDAAMVSALGANRLAFATAAGIQVEYSRDAGATWTDYGLTDTQKTAIFSGPQTNTAVIIGKPGSKDTTTGTYLNASIDNRARITITSNAANVYTALNKFVIYCSTNGSGGCKCIIEGQTKANYDADNDTWTTFADSVDINGWSGFNVINTSSITTYANTPAQYIKLRFTFYCTSAGSMATHGGLQITNIYGFGGVGWVTPSNMAKWGQIYTYDASQNVTFPATVNTGTINSANIYPRTGSNNLGSSSNKWANVYATAFHENGTSLVNKYAGISHTHNYAASDTAGGSANSVKNALTFGSKTYNGSTAQTITASDLGALTAHQDISGKVNKTGNEEINGQKTFKDITKFNTYDAEHPTLGDNEATIGLNDNNKEAFKVVYRSGTSSSSNISAELTADNLRFYTQPGRAGAANYATEYGNDHITYYPNVGSADAPVYIYNFPTESGTLATQEYIDSAAVHKSGDTMTGSLTISSGSITAPRYNDAHDWPVIQVIDDSVTQISNSYTSTRICSDTQPEWWLMGSSQGVLALKSDIPTYTFNGAVSTIKDSNLTASRALISNSSGKVAVSDVTSTELGYLDGVTSNIQTQLNAKASTSDAITSVTWTDTAGELNFKNSAGTTKSTITLPIKHYFGTTYGECYTIDAPNAEYSMQIGESGFTVDSEIPGYDRASNILQVNSTTFTYDGHNVLHKGNATKMASFYDHKADVYADIRTNQGSLTTNGIIIIVSGQVTLAGVTNLRLAHSMPNANYALFFTQVSSSSNTAYTPIVRSKTASNFSVYIGSGGIVYDYVAIYVG